MERIPKFDMEVSQSVGEPECVVLQITDCHLFENTSVDKNGILPFQSLNAVLAEALSERTADVVVASGDIAHEPTSDTYRMFNEVVRSFHLGPCLAIPGNHDVLVEMQCVLDLKPIDTKRWSLVPLDTHIEGQVEGNVSDANVIQFERQLEDARDHILVVGHHPLVDVDVPWLDEHKVQNADTVLSMLEMHPNVRAYICGHVHLESSRRHGLLNLWSTPSTCWQFDSHSDEVALSSLTPGWRWLELYQDGTIETQVKHLSKTQTTGIS